jgi:hypothetical protein
MSTGTKTGEGSIFGNLASALQSRMQGAGREQLRRMISHRRPASDGICEP